MKENLQVYSNSNNNFVFCDYDWDISTLHKNKSTTTTHDIYFCNYKNIYFWECGTSTETKLPEAYSKYGLSFVEHCQLGHSSFILYDSNNDIILAGRDYVGNYPLYYYVSVEKPANFIFSFSINALVTSKLFNLSVNYGKVVEFIEYDLYRPINNHTFYEYVYRVLPAHLLCIKQGNVQESQHYAQFNLSKYTSYTDDQLINRFQELFIISVKKLTAPYSTIGASLSGGLDSSSICSVAQSLRSTRIHTYNFKPETPEAQEDEYINAVIEKWQTDHQTIEPTHSAYYALKKVTEQNGQPFFIFNYTIQLDLIKAAQLKNCDVFLSGHWGDQVVSNGYDYFDELADKQDWKGLKEAIAHYYDHPVFIIPSDEFQTAASRKNAGKLYAIRLLWQRLKANKQWASFPSMVWILAYNFDCTIADFLRLIWQRITRKQELFPSQIASLVHPPILARKEKILQEHPPKVLDIVNMVNGKLNKAQKRYLAGIFRANELYGQETYFEVYRQNSMRSAHPFFDAELIELNLQVPLRLKFDEGRRRGTIRRALKGILPDEIANRTTKGLFTTHHLDLFKPLLADFEANTPATHPIWTIARRSVFEENVSLLRNTQIPDSKKYRLLHPIKRIIQLTIWLDYLEAQQGSNRF